MIASRFGPLAADLHHLHRQAVAGIGPQFFVAALGVLGNDGVGGIEDIFGAAIILLQFDDSAVFVIALKFQDIAEISAAPTINTLPVIPDHRDVVMLH